MGGNILGRLLDLCLRKAFFRFTATEETEVPAAGVSGLYLSGEDGATTAPQNDLKMMFYALSGSCMVST